MSTPTTSRPGRTLLILMLVLGAFSAWAFWPGNSYLPQLGLDLRGGTQVTLVPRVPEGQTLTQQQVDQTVSIIRARVDAFGVAEAEVATQGSGAGATIVVSVPGASSNQILATIASTAKLNFRPVVTTAAGLSSLTATDTATATPAPTAEPPQLPLVGASVEELTAGFETLDCTVEGALRGGSPEDPNAYIATCDQSGAAKYILGPTLVPGEQIADAIAGLPQQGATGWEVQLELTSEGARAFATATQQLVGQPSPQNQFAIVLDGFVVSAPQVNEPILGGRASITGAFTPAEANSLASVLKYGALPVTLDVAQVANVTPSLGQESLQAGILAGLIGLLLVVLYLLVYYRALGVVAVLSLLIAAAFTYVFLIILGRQVGFTLTLAGVAGTIVAIGVTADSFIVYFERMRDEIREGKGLRSAATTGWVRARQTILVADGVSLLAAVVLYFLSVGNVRGFAFMLGLTTLLDIIIAFVFTKPLVELMARAAWFQRGSKWTGVDAGRYGLEALPTATQRGRRVARTSSTSTEA